MRITRILSVPLLLGSTSPLTLPLPLPLDLNKPSLGLLHNNSTTLNTQPPISFLNSSSLTHKYWRCFDPLPVLHPTTFGDCHHISLALTELDPSGAHDLLFSSNDAADIRLPFHFRWGSSVFDLQGVEKDSWDAFPIRVLAQAVNNLAMT